MEHPVTELLMRKYDTLIGAATRIVPLEWLLSIAFRFFAKQGFLRETVDYEHS